MSEYRLSPPATLSSFAVQEAKEKRRKVLEAVRARRKIIYQRFTKKMQLHATSKSAIVQGL